MRINFLIAVFIMTIFNFSFGQNEINHNKISFEKIKQKVFADQKKYQILNTNVNQLFEEYSYQSTDKSRTYFYIGQKLNDIEILNSITSFVVKSDGQIICVRSNFINTESKTIRSAIPKIKTIDAIMEAGKALGVFDLNLVSAKNNNLEFDVPKLSLIPIKPKLYYVQDIDGSLVLAYNLGVKTLDGNHYWSMLIDAEKGYILNQKDLIVHCKIGKISNEAHDHNAKCNEAPKVTVPDENKNLIQAEASYNVFELPTEAPNFGNRKLVEDPADINASPFGWHDINGVLGADVTILHGNNVHAFNDANGDYEADNEVDGGANLIFNQQIDFTKDPALSKDAAAVNLFYLINRMHDITYSYGFNEEAGNFQFRNYSNKGQGGDEVIAMSQFSNGQTEKNNADFLTLPDGNSGQMRMFFFDNLAGVFHLTTPNHLVGTYDIGTPQFGPGITSTPIEGEIVYVKDETGGTNYGCNGIQNGGNLQGKVALIERGICEFSVKVFRAQQEGAIGVIIANFEEQLLGMAAGEYAQQVTIPSVMIKSSTSTAILNAINNGEKVTAKFEAPSNQEVTFLDASYDNGVIAHEFGHGVSTRLTGGPQSSGCLNNDEQMGEGWSDFFALAVTAKLGDKGETARGIGTYVNGETVTGGGIRSHPYSTNMTINPLTMSDLGTTSGPHALGEIWCVTIWDMYWKLVEKYGFDNDIIGGKGGNNIAIHLVIEGLKLQPCSPGFVDGRDAILQADEILHGGVNKCLIWDVFARRGIGYDASQGSSETRSDNVAGFISFPFCRDEIVVNKNVTQEVKADEEITINITLESFKQLTAKNIKVVDNIPDHSSYVVGSGGSLVNNQVIFNLDSLQSRKTASFSYKIKVDADYESKLYFQDNFLSDNIEIGSYATEGTAIFEYDQNLGQDNLGAYLVASSTGENRSILQFYPIKITGENPALVVKHQYLTQSAVDGGLFRYQLDEDRWFNFNGKIIRGNYNSKMAYASFIEPEIFGFSGNSGGYIKSFIDVNEHNGKDLTLGCFWGTSDTNFEQDGGWEIDQIEVVSPKFLNSQVCVTSSITPEVCVEAPEKGTYINHNGTIGNNYSSNSNLIATIAPNVSNGIFKIGGKFVNDDVHIRVLSSNGVSVYNTNYYANQSQKVYIPVDISGFAPGVYFVNITSGDASKTLKYIKL